MRIEILKFFTYCRNQGRFLMFALCFITFFYILNQVRDVSLFELAFEFGKSFYGEWGLFFVFVASFIEGILFVNWYFPGSFALLTGALLSRGIVPFWVFIAVSVSGFSIAFYMDYLIGRYGFYRIFVRFKFFRERLEAAQRALEKWAPAAFFTWYVHPQTGNFVATAAGILHYPVGKFLFLSTLAGLFWGTVWVGLVYIFGGVVLESIESYGYLVIMLALAVWLVVGYIREKRAIAPIP